MSQGESWNDIHVMILYGVQESFKTQECRVLVPIFKQYMELKKIVWII